MTPAPAAITAEDNQPFQIRYDPGDPDGLAFPAEADAGRVVAPEPPWWVLLVAAPLILLTAAMAAAWRRRGGGGVAAAAWRRGGGGVAVAAAWWRRIRVARAAAARPGRPYRVVPYVVRGWRSGIPAGR
ncbi:MAG: hypothetical protein ABW000_22045 [Actinoplanes sp.]